MERIGGFFFRSSPEQPEHFRSPWLVVYRVYKHVIFLWDYMKKLYIKKYGVYREYSYHLGYINWVVFIIEGFTTIQLCGDYT